MSDPRKEAFAAVRESEAKTKSIMEPGDKPTVERIADAFEAQNEAMRRCLEWIDAIEI